MSSKFNAELAFLQHLHDCGARTADAWLRTHGSSAGVCATMDTTPVSFADEAQRA